MKLLRYVDKFVAKIALAAIRVYQKTLSPDKGIVSWWLK